MTRAQQVVARLLEDNERYCADCEVEFGVMDRSLPKSHGQCRRHWLKLLRDQGIPEDRIQEVYQQMPPEAFCPDMAEQTPPKASFYPGAGPSSI